MPAMRPGTRMLLPLALVGGLTLGGCRADQEACRELADHIAALAQSEGHGGAGTAIALERDCNEQRPTRALLECMMASQTLAQLDEC
jgi:hypothetical protein